MRHGIGRLLGFTVVELMVTLTVVTVLAGIAMPAFAHLMARDRLAVASNALRGAFAAARQVAIAHNRPVSLCPGNPAQGCVGSWASGDWLVFLDRNHNAQLDPGEGVVRTGSAPEQGVVIEGNGPMTKAVVYMPEGEAQRASGAFAAGTLRVCVAQGIAPNAVDLVLSSSGRVRVQQDDFGGQCPRL